MVTVTLLVANYFPNPVRLLTATDQFASQEPKRTNGREKTAASTGLAAVTVGNKGKIGQSRLVTGTTAASLVVVEAAGRAGPSGDVENGHVPDGREEREGGNTHVTPIPGDDAGREQHRSFRKDGRPDAEADSLSRQPTSGGCPT